MKDGIQPRMTTGTRKRLTKQERRTRILEAATDVFSEKGFAGARTQEIAARAGISNALIFQHFDSKQALYGAALEHLFSAHPLEPEFAEARDAGSDADVLRRFALHVIRHTREDPRIARLGLLAALEEGEHARALGRAISAPRALQDLLTGFFEERIKAGAFKPVDTRIAATLFVEAVFMHALERITPITSSGLTWSDEEAVEALVSIFLDGLRSRSRDT